MNRIIPLAFLAAVGFMFVPVGAYPQTSRHTGLFGGPRYGYFAYDDRQGGTEPGWGFTAGVFGEVASVASDLVTLTIEGSFLQIGSRDFHGFIIPEADPPALESRSFLTAAPMFTLASHNRIGPYLQAGPTVNFRIPEEHAGTIIFGGAYGFGILAFDDHRSYMAEARYIHHWSSSAEGTTPSSTARALLLLGKIGF